MSYFNYLYENGLKVVCDKKVVFCGMVRDCAKELNHNTTTIKRMGSIIYKNYKGVEVRCEHFSLFKQLSESGYAKVFINPNMEIHYQKISMKVIVRKLRDIIYGYK